MTILRVAGVMMLGAMLSGGVSLAQTNTQDNKDAQSQLKQDEHAQKTKSKAHKDQAKADKAQRKALNSRQQKKADDAQDKANTEK